MKISVFGLGYVGCVSLGCLSNNGHYVIGVDISEVKVNLINSGKATIVEKDIDEIINDRYQKKSIHATTNPFEAVEQTELSIIAVGTPSSENGHLNLNYVFNVAKNIGEGLKNKNGFHTIAIRSTILPGTCNKVAGIIEEVSGKKNNEDFAVVVNPEFLREGSAVQDYYNPPYTLIGGENEYAIQQVSSIYESINSEIIVTDTNVAELMKYVNNSFHALKVTFGNEVGNICKALGIDSHKLMDIFVKDTQLNISPYYLKPGFAYGGSCLPKDLKGLKILAHDLYLDVPVISNIEKSNTVQIERAIKYFEDYKNKKIAFLGISFKAGTDDLRNSPTVNVIETLLGKGYTIKIFDQNVHYSQLTGANKEYLESHLPHFSQLFLNDIKEIIEWAEVIVISNNEEIYFENLRDIDDAMIIDFVRLNKELFDKPNYTGLNW